MGKRLGHDTGRAYGLVPTLFGFRALLRAVLVVFVVLGLGLASRRACAADKSAVSPSHLKLPEGPGSLEGLGENAEPNLSMGLMTYGVPIAVPEGYPGMSPSLRLGYSSGSPSSIVGMGWSLGVPSIERMTSRGLPHYTAADRFAAGGSDELVLVDGENGTYRARYEGSFVRYTRVDEDGDGAGGYWLAEYPDGRVGYFGATAEGELVASARLEGDPGVFRYMLVEVVDTLGHSLNYEYVAVDGMPLLSRAAYVWDGDEPRYELYLSYEERPDVVSDAKPGFETRLTHRLTGLQVRARGEQVRRYALEYEDHAGLSRLARVSSYGMRDADGPYPAVFSFGYTGGASDGCGLGTCASPAVHVIEGSSGVNLSVGAADFVDMNGDGLPDIVDTSTERHTIHLNQRASSGLEVEQRFSTPQDSAGGSLDLASPNVSMLDVNGDGFADMVDTESHTVLSNHGTGDWEEEELFDALDMPSLADDADARVVDVDNDGCIDVLHCDAGSSWFWRSDCTGHFSLVQEGVDVVGAGFTENGLQLADMNGDGLQDLVLRAPDLVAYWLSYGNGRWSQQRTMAGVPADVEIGFQLTDLSGDGLAELVRVTGNAVSFALNENGEQFAPLETLEGSSELDIPALEGSTALRFADMNGSGSTDVVWVTSSGAVTYLELFPERPNLLTRISNGLGKEIAIEYGSTVEHMARDGGPAEWTYRLPHPMLTVDRLRTWDTLSEVEQVRSFHHRDGYYDSVEKQFRGFIHVEASTAGDATSEPKREEYEFNVGQDDPYYKALLVGQAVWSGAWSGASGGERALEETRNEYRDCGLTDAEAVEPEGAGAGSSPPEVRYICQDSTAKLVKEGQPAAEWLTIAERYEYDGYGNRTLTEKQGVIERGGGCGECIGDGPSAGGDFGEPCGENCLGDEAYERTEFVSPDNTGGRWLLDRPLSKTTFGVEGSESYAEERYYYDGEPLVGMAEGQLREGLLVRTSARVNTSNEVVDTARTAYSEHGAPIQIMDANGHSRRLEYDSDGLQVVAELAELEGSSLRLEVGYHPVLDKVTWSSSWTLGSAAIEQSRVTEYGYDGFGRITAIAAPGDSLEAPTQEFGYQLADPVSSIATRRRSVSGGALDTESIQCFDGMGRELQKRVLLEPGGDYQVSGYTEYNAAGQASRSFYPFRGPGADCDTASPDAEGVPVVVTSFDGAGRALSVEYPPEDGASGASRSETQYLPLESRAFDEEDTEPDSPHFETPTVTRMDGLGRKVAFLRYLSPEEATPLGLLYDELGNLRGYLDSFGNRKTQEYDLLGRVLSVEDPDSGRTAFEYDPVGNAIAETDARGVTVRREFDAANRLLAEWEDENREETELQYQYDSLSSCGACTHAVGLPVAVQYPMPGESPALGIERFGYDARGQQAYFSRSMGEQEFCFYTEYDNLGRVVQKRYPAELSLSFTYDGADRLASVPGYVSQVRYNERGLTSGHSLENGLDTTYQYDGRLRLSALDSVLPSGEPLQEYAYARDRVGNILDIADSAATGDGPSANAAYGYDSWYRLTSAVLDPGRSDEESLSYEYDAIDNIVSKTSELGSQSAEHVGSYTYGERGAGPHAVTTAGDHSLDYDAAGQLVSSDMSERGTDDYTWDFLGRMASAARSGSELARFTYGPTTDRVKKVEQGQTTYYLTPEFELRDGLATLYVMVGAQRVAKVEVATATTAQLPDLAPAELVSGVAEPAPDGLITAGDAWIAEAAELELFELEEGSANVDALLAASARRALAEVRAEEPKVTYLHYDHLGSVVAATDTEGTVVERRTQYPYGMERSPAVPLAADYVFTGKEKDWSTGLLYFGARYYSAELGRWVSADPLARSDAKFAVESPWEAANPHTYVKNGPLRAIDVVGLAESDPVIVGMRQSFNERDALTYNAIDCSGLAADMLDAGYQTGEFTKAKNNPEYRTAGRENGGGADNLYNYLRAGTSPLGPVETHADVALASFELQAGDVVFWDYRSSTKSDKAMNHVGIVLSPTELANSRSPGPTIDNPAKKWVQTMKQKDVKVAVIRPITVEFPDSLGDSWDGP